MQAKKIHIAFLDLEMYLTAYLANWYSLRASGVPGVYISLTTIQRCCGCASE